MFSLLKKIDKALSGDGRAYIPDIRIIEQEVKQGRCKLCGEKYDDCKCEG